MATRPLERRWIAAAAFVGAYAAADGFAAAAAGPP